MPPRRLTYRNAQPEYIATYQLAQGTPDHDASEAPFFLALNVEQS